MPKIQMVDLIGQHQKIREELNLAINEVLDSAHFIKGPKVSKFEKGISKYLNVGHVISCANGTDAIQIALMALELQPRDEVLVPAFTYVSAIEVITLLQLVPIFVDVEFDSFNINSSLIEEVINEKTKAIIVVHLFGQMADMDEIMNIAKQYDLYVIEDNAQSFGAKTLTGNFAGTVGHIGCTSFFPTKVLGGMGDGGAINTDDPMLAQKMRIIAQHGQSKKYHHAIVGVNSRLDTIQAAILNVKLQYLEGYIENRKSAAANYDHLLASIEEVIIPHRTNHSDHVYHQYTIKVKDGKRDALKEYLRKRAIPTAIYYPIATNEQEAYKLKYSKREMPISNLLTKQVLSLPMHTELSQDQINYICEEIALFYK